ncbi:MAG: DUF2975 domain-containing protein [Firmicutes bacterium]|nr:DUF2975 domain-containing protein [Bacillota bacterium]
MVKRDGEAEKREKAGKCEKAEKHEKAENRDTIWTKGTKYLLDFMFYGGILVTVSLPWSIRWIGQQLPDLIRHYEESVIIYFVLGIAAEKLLWELRKIFRTVLAENCFVRENVVSLQKMGNWSFFIALMSVVRSIVYMTPAMGVVILVFVIAGLFSKVLSFVFEQAVAYKEETDWTV